MNSEVAYKDTNYKCTRCSRSSYQVYKLYDTDCCYKSLFACPGSCEASLRILKHMSNCEWCKKNKVNSNWKGHNATWYIREARESIDVWGLWIVLVAVLTWIFIQMGNFGIRLWKQGI